MLMNKNNNNNNNNNIKNKQKNSNKKITTFTNENNSPLQINLNNSKKLYNPFSDIKKLNVRKRTSSFIVTSTKMIIKNNKQIFNKFYGQKLKIKKSSEVKNNNEEQKKINITLNKNFDQMSINSQQTLKKFSTNNLNFNKEFKEIKINNSNNINNKNLNKKIETKKELKIQNNNFLYKIKRVICFCLPN